MSSDRAAALLDHIIILLPYADIVNPPEWLTTHFTISSGGRHADNKTENRLILFRDGTYAELIAFIEDDPKKRQGHWWDKPFGVVDYSLTSVGTEPDVESLNRQLREASTGLSYLEPREGGRKRPDGVELRWKVTFPDGIERGPVPFWCHDLTPRENRVPLTPATTTHPCGATGVAGMLVEVGEERSKQVSDAVAVITGAGPQESNEYAVGVPNEAGEKQPTIRVQAASDTPLRLSLLIQTSQHPAPEDIVQKVGNGTVQIQFKSA